jgi:hypothetical protein
MTAQTNFEKHLHFESQINSREFHVDRCMKTLEMIAVLKDRIERSKIELNSSKKYWLYHPPSSYQKTLDFQIQMRERLEKYFNYRLGLIKQF